MSDFKVGDRVRRVQTFRGKAYSRLDSRPIGTIVRVEPGGHVQVQWAHNKFWVLSNHLHELALVENDSPISG